MMVDSYSTKPQFDRVFFIVDRSRLKDEKDELKNAIVVYIPEKDLSKPTLEQRCSQLVGISILINCFTGKLPKFIRLRNNGFAIRLLGSDLIMGLQTKFDEPKWCVYQAINRIHDFFTFYYSSPTKVMQMARDDWEIYTTQMGAIFHCIIDFTLKDSRSLPSMFIPLPYVSLDPDKGGTQLYIKAQRLLRLCQRNESIIGGCMFYEGEMLCSQLPPEMGEKLLLAASGGIELNSRSILEDQLAPKTVWIINVYLTTEQLALSKYLRRRIIPTKSMYKDSLKPNPNLDTEIQEQQRYQNVHVEKLVSLNKTEGNKLNDGERPLVLPTESEDFVSISYGSNAVSFTKKTEVNFLKRSKSNKRSSLFDNGDYDTDQIGRGIFDPLPPLPDKRSRPPPIPPRKYDIDDTMCVPPVPDRIRESTIPLPLPRKGAGLPPEPPPRTSIKYNDPVHPPLPPPRGATVRLNNNDKKDDSPIVAETGDLSSPGIYGTPRSSFDVSEELIQREEESDHSEGYRTPSPSSPLSLHKELVTCDSDGTLSQSNYFTGSSKEDIDVECNHSLPPPPTTTASGTLLANGSNEDRIPQESEENHYEFDDEQLNETEIMKKMSTSSSGSLVITKAISEIWSEGSLTPEQQRHKVDIVNDISFTQSEPTDGSRIHSPVPNESIESLSEDDQDDISTLQNERFISTMRQTRLDKLAANSTAINPKHYKTDNTSKFVGQSGSSMHKKCLYVQKCVNTVVAILADEDLPDNTEVIKSLWTNLLSSIIILNNNVERSTRDQDSIYADFSRNDSNFRSYHAGFSTNIAMCEVSSITAPYQFRHAVRRVHYEYTQDPTLRQVSLCKEHCRMISQNVLGREVYYHSNRVGSNDALLSHSLIEKQVKMMSKSNYVSDAYTVDFL